MRFEGTRLRPRLGAELARRIERSNPPEAQILRLDIDKAANDLGWRPTLSVDDAVRLTAGWCRARVDDPTSVGEITREIEPQPDEQRVKAEAEDGVDPADEVVADEPFDQAVSSAMNAAV